MIGSLVGILAPAVLALKTKMKRQGTENERSKGINRWVLQYAVEILKNVFLTTATITYILKIDDVNFSALSNFPFFTKYVVIAVAYAWLLPYVEEVISKYVSISFKIEVEGDAEEKDS